jgi:hypothetical protein
MTATGQCAWWVTWVLTELKPPAASQPVTGRVPGLPGW